MGSVSISSQPGGRVLIYLADLTHTGPVLSSNYFPLAPGLLAAYLLKHVADEVEIELFKYPQDLTRALEHRTPTILGFSNYSWNCDISYQFATRVKQRHPQTTIVFGGPNYDLCPEEIADFWQRYPNIDFHVVREGEEAMLSLYRLLQAHNFDAAALKCSGVEVPSCHFVRGDRVIEEKLLPRLKELESIGSPYLLGLLDKFFDNVLTPTIHTTRGCPFECTFCTEGDKYYTKVANRSALSEELEYIAKRIGTVQDLCISDANFGMFKQDQEKAEAIAAVQKTYGWPRHIIVNTGKNQKERVVSVAKILGGAMRVGASLQSTSEIVLKNVARTNISLEALHQMASDKAASKDGTFTELILGLPGDTAAAHAESLRYTVEAGFGTIRMYQAIMLPQTELYSRTTRKQYGLETLFRIMPRSFGKYDLYGVPFCSAEAEEIVVGNNTLSREDYLDSRELDLSVEIVHNGEVFSELAGLCAVLGVPFFSVLERFHHRRREFTPALKKVYDTFRVDSMRLWPTREALESEIRSDIDRFLGISEGTNEMAKGKAVAFFSCLPDLHDAIYGEAKAALADRDLLVPAIDRYLDELKAYSLVRKVNLVSADDPEEMALHFDFKAIAEQRYRVEPNLFYSETPRRFRFYHSDKQHQMIDGYIKQYGLTVDGLGRILMRAPIRFLFREFLDQVVK